MKLNKLPIMLVLVLAFWLGFYNTPSLSPEVLAQEKVSIPGEYSGYSPVLYNGDQLFSQYVTVRDGTKLAVDIWRPTLNGELVTKPLPVIWMHSPYNRRHYPATTPILAVDLYPGAARGLIKYGYVIAVVDARGRYASYGKWLAVYNRGQWLEPAFWDAYDITEWFAAQSWSDGKVGMWGCSATGGTQLQAAATMPPHLKAIFPMSCEIDWYGFGSGIVSTEAIPAPEIPGPISGDDIYAVPVDEDTDGSMLAEASEEHRYSLSTGPVPYRDTVAPWLLERYGISVQWNLLGNPYAYADQIERSRVAMYNAGNWEDRVANQLRTGLFYRFNSLNNPAKVLIGPGGHCIWYTDYSPKPYPLTFPIVTEEHRWFDYWLKGIDNGIMDEPPIYYFTYHAPSADKDWKFAWQWPLPNEQRVNYYLGNQTLSKLAPAMDGRDDTETGPLAYTTVPLTSDLELTGHPAIKLWVTSTAENGDFLAHLEDVAPDGSSTDLPGSVDGGLRASNRALHTPPYDTLGLPWHRTYETDQTPLIPGEPVELAFDLGPTSYIFKAGHAIRLIITCSAPAVLSPPPVITVYHNPTYPSCVTLPVAGAPIEAHVRIAPKVLNTKSNGIFTVFVTFSDDLSEGYIKDLNIESVTLNGISPLRANLAGGKWDFQFSRQAFDDIFDVGENKLTLKGSFGASYNYGNCYFEGSDWVRVNKN